jgi:hypothetical protein
VTLAPRFDPAGFRVAPGVAHVCGASPQAAAIVAGMERRGVLAWNGRGRIRVSFHGYNGSDDMLRASDALIAEWRATPGGNPACA